MNKPLRVSVPGGVFEYGEFLPHPKRAYQKAYMASKRAYIRKGQDRTSYNRGTSFAYILFDNPAQNYSKLQQVKTGIRIIGKDEVPGSNPGISSIRKTLLLLENSGVFPVRPAAHVSNG